MATLTISLSGSSVVNGSKNWTISDQDVQRIVTRLQNQSLADTGQAITAQQALVQWATSFINATNQQVAGGERREQEAAITIPPITFT